MSDLLPLISVYGYVAALLLISEKTLKNEVVSRKFLHIMVGNIAFILPFFESRFVMAFLAAFPFVVLTFLMSPHSPVKLSSRTSVAGHGLGLVYYSIAWTVLAYAFFDRPDVIAVGIMAMSYGDGLASLIGGRYGKRKFRILGDEKSLEGSVAMFLGCVASFSVVSLYYHGSAGPLLLPLAAFATVVEAVTPKGLDNLSVSILTAILYFWMA
ncbi:MULTISPECIES: diacylglycerol/polyprenol kinase family protein [Archaeoglobus]|jgi:dolichol kinase|uniref:Phosphatidate cytidylyltransferase n=3 Tax=Archaeoglobus fulgidus TaxID=2234 RepID=O28960_ARCFU|nr:MULTISPECIES: diacylglycerol/polyprenol kinase family protein [Archaeoglobus]AAB89938.1 conserved hypothetical protein [Archaeoglobus fulgidus DSM 4304]AIG98189.1 Dolichol kinase [Archaeoglobus fulgidus DSM 8774]KUJ93051.1 MAG: hypothetical protein XD40_1734 [Archaeoglobus fulgidus]KUK06198.1 MAG: hypothetical protein XD48_1580 [Archaeoglobus fulgidus]MDI3498084.1 phytol kinase [Archaeoglobus sp.]